MEHFEDLRACVDNGHSLMKTIDQLKTITIGEKIGGYGKVIRTEDESGILRDDLDFLGIGMNEPDIKRAVDSFKRSAIKTLKAKLDLVQKELEAYAIKKK